MLICKFQKNLRFGNGTPYMLATIIKSPKAVQTTISIIQTFAKVKEISRAIVDVINEPEDSPRQKTLSSRVGNLVGELIMPDETDLGVVTANPINFPDSVFRKIRVNKTFVSFTEVF